MSTLVLNLDDRLASTLSALAARNHKELPEWATEQLTLLAEAAEMRLATSYSAEWWDAFGSISDADFASPSRPTSRSVEPLDAD
jgi:hypothetical protein